VNFNQQKYETNFLNMTPIYDKVYSIQNQENLQKKEQKTIL
jgi:hypothetical protein